MELVSWIQKTERWAKTGVCLTSNAPMASLKPCPSAPTMFSLGTTTFSKLISLVSEHRWPMLISLGSTVIPAESPSTLRLPPGWVSVGLWQYNEPAGLGLHEASHGPVGLLLGVSDGKHEVPVGHSCIRVGQVVIGQNSPW